MSSSFAKKLADSDARVRERAFAAVSKWLAGRTSLSELDARKLWRGLFYSYWHADGRGTQLDVADKMGALMHALNREVAMSYAWACAWTMRTEWSGIDKHRMDKFCLLSRRVLHHALRFAGERRWDSTERLGEVLGDGVFGDASGGGVGYKLHVAETFLREVDAVCKGESGLEMDDGETRGGAPTPIPSSTLATLLMVFVRAMETEESQVLLRRIRTDVFEPLCDPSRATENSRAARLTPSGLKTLYETAISLGARDGVEDVCRENLYELHGILKRGANKITKEAEARGVDPEADDVEAAAPPKKKKKAQKNGVATTDDDSVGKNTKKKKEKKAKRGANDDVSEKESQKREKKRRKKERRLAKETAAAAAKAAARAEEEDDEPKKKKKKKAKTTTSTDETRNGSQMVAMRAVVDRGNSASPTPSLDSLDSPSMSPRTRRLMWNDDGITYSSPDARAPINTAKGKRNLRMTPPKTIFRPIHGKTYSAPAKPTKSRLSHGGGKKRAAESFF